MSQSSVPAPDSTESLSTRWAKLREENPKMRIRNAADALGVSEAELLATQCGTTVTRLNVSDWGAFMQSWKGLGKVMVLTRNEHCVHEKTGEYEQIHPLMHGGKIGLITGKVIDLRLFLSGWTHAFAVDEEGPRGRSRSLQVFDASGTAIHKIYVKSDEGVAPFEALCAQYKSDDQSEQLSVEATPAPKPDQPDAEINKESLLDAWSKLQDTHDFFPMIMKHRVGRVQALRLAEGTYTRKVSNGAARVVLDLARDLKVPIMVFVGNDHCIQIHSGPVEKLMEYQDWYNVMDPDFNLHLLESGIYSSWLVRKPSADGEVNSLEIFDKDGNNIAQFFGERKPGIPELDSWRELLREVD